MEVNSISALTSLVDGSQATARKNAAPADGQRKSAPNGLNAGSTPSGLSSPHVLTSLTNTNYIKDQLEAIMYSFPPFFPVGSPQRVDLIKGMKGVQDEIKKSSALAPEVKEKLTAQKLTNESTDAEVAAALKDLKQYKEAVSPAPAPVTGKSYQGTIVGVKI